MSLGPQRINSHHTQPTGVTKHGVLLSKCIMSYVWETILQYYRLFFHIIFHIIMYFAEYFLEMYIILEMSLLKTDRVKG
jgi:hypothetical protein